ncbi:Uncharacterized protein involved in cytokinesis, contains TGc (transglutaminase/protease-like) domain [Slackia heliotrinireducens]|uniref:Transglutaminase-like domain-containing protein n=1 Tax=Slackia heliotrinireducens (strain ATCC 29202 / DSM 20476 / NCTC 11029 / RHS 1) TaxID=471855 RepID=C7N126_SLAHD|nr:transglutaminase domain-containing protein [Slackia heliotrinireducens]ACV23248.1 hypothetical protein Shel_22380 [Slackia heliotrinireducens DSM 20476]VEH02389.1 Uncharacterized protein involved in cytokinesis, contains TGc (transglutaminase/protease-like) domain [Slackia heliotrinireducens]
MAESTMGGYAPCSPTQGRLTTVQAFSRAKFDARAGLMRSTPGVENQPRRGVAHTARSTQDAIRSLMPARQFRYEYERLNPEEKGAYRSLLEGFLAFRPEFTVEGADHSRLNDILVMMRRDIPEMFWVKEFSMRYYASKPKRVTVVPAYNMTQAELLRVLRRMDEVACRVQRAVFGMRDVQKAQVIHDFMVNNVTYDLDIGWSAYRACGPLVGARGGCAAIAMAYKYLADHCGLRCQVVYGDASDTPGDYDNMGGHAWNIIWVDGAPYQMDVTFDLTLSKKGPVRYDYFLLSDAEMAFDHEWSRSRYAPCSHPNTFFKNQGRYAESRQELLQMVKDAAKNGSYLQFKLAPHACSGDESEWIFDIAYDAFHQVKLYNMKMSLSSHDPLHVHTLRWSKAA